VADEPPFVSEKSQGNPEAGDIEPGDARLQPARAVEPPSDSVWLFHDAHGSGHIWQVLVGGRSIWSHAAIEGPVPDALDLWDALAKPRPRGGGPVTRQNHNQEGGTNGPRQPQ
jgi:hypothetical protein